MAQEKRYYYKAKSGKGFLNLKTPLSKVEAKEYTEITKEEFETLTHVEKHTPTQAEVHAKEVKSQIAHLKAELAKTDYQAIKHSEGWISEEDYAPIKAARQAIRDQINALEEEIA